MARTMLNPSSILALHQRTMLATADGCRCASGSSRNRTIYPADRIAFWQNASHRKQRLWTPHPRVAHQASEKRQPTECEAGVKHQSVCIQHPHEYHVHEKPLSQATLTTPLVVTWRLTQS